MLIAAVKLAAKDLPSRFAFPESHRPLFLLRTQDEDQMPPFAWQSDTTWQEAFVVGLQERRKEKAAVRLHLEMLHRPHPEEELVAAVTDQALD